MGGRGAGLVKGKGRNITLNPIGGKLDPAFIKGMQDTLNKEGTDLAKEVYSKLFNLLQYGGANRDKTRAYYNVQGGKAYFNQGYATKGNSIYKPYEIAFHEFGHAIDYLGKSPILSRSQSLHLNNQLRADYRQYKKNMGFKSDSDVVQHLKTTFRGKARTALSDAIEGMTYIPYPLGAGHNTPYHKRPGATGMEFFANVLCTAAANPRGYAALKEVFPNSVAIVENEVKKMI